MRIAKYMIVFLLILIFGGCASPSRPDRPVAVDVLPQPEEEVGLTEVVRTVIPQEVQPEEENTGAAPTLDPSAVYPVERPVEETVVLYPPPANTESAAEDTRIQPYQDCARTPGLSGCGAAPFALTGRLALSDRSEGRVIVLDLDNGSGWQMVSHPSALAWSPDGDRLLLIHHTDGGEQYELWHAGGQLLPSPAIDSLARWQEDGTLAPLDTLRNEAGDQARLERSPKGSWTLHLRPVGEGESSLAVSPQQADQIFVLLDWIPGSQELLAQRSYDSGAAVQSGGQLVTIDIHTGLVQDLDLLTAPGLEGSLAWNPAQPGLLAVRTVSLGAAGERGAGPGLTLLDLYSGQRRDPLPAGLSIEGLAWRPDGRRLAFAVDAMEALSPPEAAAIFDGPGIYLLDPQTGEVERATQPPTGSLDGWPQWTSAGKLVYARYSTADPSRPLAQVVALDPESGHESILFHKLPVLPPGHAGMDWSAILAFSD